MQVITLAHVCSTSRLGVKLIRTELRHSLEAAQIDLYVPYCSGPARRLDRQSSVLAFQLRNPPLLAVPMLCNDRAR